MKLLKRQPMMRRVILATLPCVAGSVYYFGWRSLAVIAVSCLAVFLTEYAFCRRRKEPVTEAVFVTGILYALVMPPTVPWHVLIIGVVFAIAFVKEAFGGFGRNVFNPAVAGRCFVYVCFPVAMTSTWAPVSQGPLGALNQWTTAGVDAITSATPMALMKAGEISFSSSDIFHGLFLGRIAGTMGVTSALLILIGGSYLYFTKTANRTLIITVVATYAVLNQALHWLGVEPVPGALPAVLGGGFLFGAFFMVTDPISAPSTQGGRIAYAMLIAVCTLIIRNFSIFNGGLMFSILIGNMFGPILDHAAKALKNTGRGAAE
ncbi:MAG TPA: RnfABCDGE type electron transport complex subunit D [Kiritimatiellia bacterium]|nr:RnfABCDGE type electron transport complex subunit D [Kiritimatiellia bacterium]